MSGLFVKLDVTYFSDDQIVELSPEAQLLYIRALCLCQTLETDGVFTAAQLRSTGARLGSARDPLRYLRELTVPTPRPQCADTVATPTSHLPYAREATCLTPVEQLDDRRYRITAWLEHNKPAAEIRRIRGERAKAGRKGGLATADEKADQGEQNASNLLDECEASSQASETETETESKTESKTTTTTATPPDPGTADDSQVDDVRFDVVCRHLASRAADRAPNITSTRAVYEKGALKNLIAERGDEIRALLKQRPSASAETIVDLLAHGVAPPVGRGRDPEANRHTIDRVIGELMDEELIGGSAFVPPELATPLPPALAARARHEEDEVTSVAS